MSRSDGPEGWLDYDRLMADIREDIGRRIDTTTWHGLWQPALMVDANSPEPSRNQAYLDARGGRWTFEDAECQDDTYSGAESNQMGCWTWRSVSGGREPLRLWRDWATLTDRLAAEHWPWRVDNG